MHESDLVLGAEAFYLLYGTFSTTRQWWGRVLPWVGLVSLAIASWMGVRMGVRMGLRMGRRMGLRMGRRMAMRIGRRIALSGVRHWVGGWVNL